MRQDLLRGAPRRLAFAGYALVHRPHEAGVCELSDLLADRPRKSKGTANPTLGGTGHSASCRSNGRIPNHGSPWTCARASRRADDLGDRAFIAMSERDVPRLEVSSKCERRAHWCRCHYNGAEHAPQRRSLERFLLTVRTPDLQSDRLIRVCRSPPRRAVREPTWLYAPSRQLCRVCQQRRRRVHPSGGVYRWWSRRLSGVRAPR